jgi:hypothetical protein
MGAGLGEEKRLGRSDFHPPLQGEGRGPEPRHQNTDRVSGLNGRTDPRDLLRPFLTALTIETCPRRAEEHVIQPFAFRPTPA